MNEEELKMWDEAAKLIALHERAEVCEDRRDLESLVNKIGNRSLLLALKVKEYMERKQS